MNSSRQPPLKALGVLTLIVIAAVLAVVVLAFRGDLAPTTTVTMFSKRVGLVMETGSKVTYNGIVIGRVAEVSSTNRDGKSVAKLILKINPRYLVAIPSNVRADIKASTVFGNKYVALSTPRNPSPARITSADVIDASSVTTEFNTLFETITSIAEKVDPVRLNLTLSATAEALNGLGARFGRSIVNGNAVLDEINPQMPLGRVSLTV